MLSRVDWYTVRDGAEVCASKLRVRRAQKDCLTPKKKAIKSFVTSVDIYQSARRNVSEHLNIQYRFEKLKSP